MSLLALLLALVVAGLVSALLPSRRQYGAIFAGVTSLGGLVAVALRFPEVREGGVLTERYPWVPELGLELVLRLDGLSWVMSVIVLGIGTLVTLYAAYYLSARDPQGRFFAFLLAFMGAMLGVVLSGNLLLIAFFWELTSLFSFLLIGYWNQRKDAQRGARMALTVTGLGGLCLLAGVLVLGQVVGSYDLEQVLSQGELVRAHVLYPVALGLILLGVFTKSAQMPLHFWLPNAMAAPTPVSAYLHSATLVKLGVFLLARLWPVLSGSSLWFWLVGGAGLITLLGGAWVALFQRDLKGLLAYSTLSHLGLIVLLFGLNSPLAAVAGVFHLMNHAAFKASLFMAVGIIDHETGTRDIRRLSGLYRYMPITATLALVATAAMAGVPLLNGFLSKEMFFAETVYVTSGAAMQWVLPALATLAGMGSVAYSLRFAREVFFGPPERLNTPRTPEEAPRWLRIPVEVLVLLCVVVGVVPGASVGPLLAAAAWQVVGGTPPPYSLAVWHGFNLPLLMSGVAMAGGVLLYLAARRWNRAQTPRLTRLSGAKAFFGLLALLTRWARATRRVLLTAGLQRQVLAVVLVTIAVALLALRGGLTAADRPLIPLSPMFAALWVVGGAAALGAAYQAKFHRLAALMLLGVAGAITCVTFIWFSAPDLALTQLAVETVTTLLILLGLRWMPAREPKRGVYDARTLRVAWARRGRDLLVALGAGGGMAVLSYLVMRRESAVQESYFLEHALSGGGGRNVVNVLLVDFRGFDTFGEGVVLGLVALTVYALLRRFRPAEEVMARPPQQRLLPQDLQTDLVHPRHSQDTAVGYLAVPAVLVRLLLPVVGVVAVFLFLRGHNAPGGGFVAGLVLSVGFLLQYVVSGTQWVEERLNLRPRALIAVGLLFVLGTAAGSWVVDFPLLTSHTFHFELPLIGEVHLPSATFFDVGIFCLVLGSTLFILVALAHQSIRSHRATGGD